MQVTAPVAGAFGAVSVMTKEVETSARFWRGKPVGRRHQRRQGPMSIPSLVISRQILNLKMNPPDFFVLQDDLNKENKNDESNDERKEGLRIIQDEKDDISIVNSYPQLLSPLLLGGGGKSSKGRRNNKN